MRRGVHIEFQREKRVETFRDFSLGSRAFDRLLELADLF